MTDVVFSNASIWKNSVIQGDTITAKADDTLEAVFTVSNREGTSYTCRVNLYDTQTMTTHAYLNFNVGTKDHTTKRLEFNLTPGITYQVSLALYIGSDYQEKTQNFTITIKTEPEDGGIVEPEKICCKYKKLISADTWKYVYEKLTMNQCEVKDGVKVDSFFCGDTPGVPEPPEDQDRTVNIEKTVVETKAGEMKENESKTVPKGSVVNIKVWFREPSKSYGQGGQVTVRIRDLFNKTTVTSKQKHISPGTTVHTLEFSITVSSNVALRAEIVALNSDGSTRLTDTAGIWNIDTREEKIPEDGEKDGDEDSDKGQPGPGEPTKCTEGQNKWGQEIGLTQGICYQCKDGEWTSVADNKCKDDEEPDGEFMDKLKENPLIIVAILAAAGIAAYLFTRKQ